MARRRNQTLKHGHRAKKPRIIAPTAQPSPADTLKRIYFGKDSGESFRSLKKLGKVTGQSDANVTGWAKGQDTYTLFRPARKNYPRLPIISQHANYLWEADTIDLTNMGLSTESYFHVLTCIDVFTKKASIRPLQSKTAANVRTAFASIFAERNAKPHKLRTDQGKKFIKKLSTVHK